MTTSLTIKKALSENVFSSALKLAGIRTPVTYFKFESFFHPHLAVFIKQLNQGGIPALLTLANQSLGNPYLHSSWKPGYLISTAATGPASLIEGGIGTNPALGRPGNFELVVLEGNNLQHYSHDSSDVSKPWTKGQVVTSEATGPGCLIERLSTRQTDGTGKVIRAGDFEVVVLVGNELRHFSRDNSNPANSWVFKETITQQATGPGCVIESSFISGGRPSLDLIVLERSELAHYRRDNASGQWERQDLTITRQATGPGCIIESSFKSSSSHGDFEVIVPEGPQLVHYTRNNAKNQWTRQEVITDEAGSAGWLIESRIKDSQFHGNFEVVVSEGGQLVHYWKDNSAPGNPWRRGQMISERAGGAACIIHGGFGQVGNFEVVVPENGRLVHYWHINEGTAGTEAERFYFNTTYKPTKYVDDPYPRHNLDFSYGGAYSLYNWELFFHVPLLLATRLSKNQRFENALDWYKYIFNPTLDSPENSTRRFWQVLPLRDTPKERLDHMLGVLSDPAAKGSPERQQIESQLDEWGKHPFSPHSIARIRLSAYQKTVIMKYIDNLIAWGDQLFGQDTIEAINEATQLYIQAASLLGERPQKVPQRTKPQVQTFAQLRPKLDSFSNVRQQLENEFPYTSTFSSVEASTETSSLLGLGESFYFCLPSNDKILEYWDTVADRLFKIRNCMNIEGVVRQLPLFEPPIDPALLVQAAAKGVDLGSILSDLNAPMPYYRFSYMLQKALEVCGELRLLASTLLSALEKRDAEELAAIRSSQEVEILNQIREVKNFQYNEAVATYNGLLAAREMAGEKYKHFATLLGKKDFKLPGLDVEEPPLVDDQVNLKEGAEGGLPLLQEEQNEIDASHSARDWQVRSATTEVLASLTHYIPTFVANVSPLGVGLQLQFGGPHVGPALTAISRYQKGLSDQDAYDSTHAGKMGLHTRAQQERVLQHNLAAREVIQINKQLLAAQVRIDMSSKELDNHDTQITQAQNILEYLGSKYTNQELYGWLQGEISTIYFQCYQLAYDLAKKAERCYRFERGVSASNFIQFGYWDSLRKGLMTGERLYLALKQMERAYQEQDKRDYEITKNVSLLMQNPQAFIQLKETGQVIFDLPEPLFDSDYPGHFMRRLKNVSLTIPCVVGPYTSINCTLTLLSNKTRIKSTGGPAYPETTDQDDDRFITNFAPLQSIATSNAQNDNGMFELNFRDERYLPFEGAGAVSRWRIDLPKENNAFDFETITDVILHLKYTAREGGEILKAAARKSLKDLYKTVEGSNLARFFSVRHEFPVGWYNFLHPVSLADTTLSVQLDLSKDRFPFLFSGKKVTLNQIAFFLKLKEGFNQNNLRFSLGKKELFPPQAPVQPIDTGPNPPEFKTQGSLIDKILFYQLGEPQIEVPAGLVLQINKSDVTALTEKNAIEDLWLICNYSVEEP